MSAVALHSKTWLERTNPNWAYGASLALLLAIILSPFVEQRRLPFSTVFHDPPTAAEIENATAPIRAERDEFKLRLADALRKPAPAPPSQDIAKATAPFRAQIAQLQTPLDEMTRQRDRALHQAPSRQEPPPIANGPIIWDPFILPWTTRDAGGMLFLGIAVFGTSNALVELTHAYVDLEITGERKELQISVAPGPQLAPLSEINQIPPGVRIELWAAFNPAIRPADLLAHWG